MPFENRRFLSEVDRTEVGSVRILIRPATAKGRFDNHRQLAAELERRSDESGARWVVSPAAFDRRIDLELVEGDDVDAAARFVTSVLADLGLA